MKVQLLSFPGCPNTAAALESLREVLASRRPGVHVEEIDMTATDAPAGLRGWGSPTILIDGQDVGGAVAPGHTSCRLYRDANGRMQGVPPRALIEAAVARAGQGRVGWLRSLAAVPGAALPPLAGGRLETKGRSLRNYSCSFASSASSFDSISEALAGMPVHWATIRPSRSIR